MGVCTVSGVTITLVATGTCSITASQAGNATYNAASPVTQTFVVSALGIPPSGAIFDLSNTPQFPGGVLGTTYRQFTTSFVGDGNMEYLSFAFREVPAYFAFDNASVTASGSSVNLLTNPGFEQGVTTGPPDVATNYPDGWGRWIQTGDTTAIGEVASNSNLYGCSTIHAQSGAQFWCDGSVQGFDAIYQPIQTTLGVTYTVTFYLADSSGQSISNPNIDMLVYVGDQIPVGNTPINTIVSSVVCNPTSLSQSAVSNCSVTLSQNAPAGGSVVTLASNNASLTVPASVAVAAGSATASFSATAASTITASQSATVTATLGTSSQTATINLVVSLPAISSLSPYSATAGGPAFTLTVSGSSFVSGCTVDWGATALTTTFVSTTQLTAIVPAAQIASSGAASITVACPALTTSSPATLTILPPSGQTWTQLAPTGGPPSLRSGHTAVFDPVTAKMVTYAGVGSGVFSDVWSLTTGLSPQWTNITPTGTAPAPRYGQSAVYDSANSVMTIFGGYVSVSCANDVWTLTNANGVGGTPAWTQLNPTGSVPAARRGHQAVYDPASNRMIVFGGTNCLGSFYNDVWVLTNANGLPAGTQAWMQLSPAGTLPTGRAGLSAVYDTTSNNMVVFAGDGASGDSSDVWILSDANGVGGTPAWTQLTPTGSLPVPRAGHTAVYDSASNHMTVFGGQSEFAVDLNDTWVLSNANGSGGTPAWNQLAPLGPIPAIRGGHTAVFASSSNQMIVFAGNDNGTALNDVWTLSDSNGAFVTTSSVTPATTPVNNPAAAITIAGTNFNPGATVLFTPPGGTQTSVTPSQITATQIVATVPSSLLTTSGTAQVVVTDGSGVPSAALSFTISPLTISAVTPNSTSPGSATAITVNGQYFNSSATVLFTPPGGVQTSIAPSQVQATQLMATIPSGLLATAGTAQVAVLDPNSTVSNSLPFAIQATPAISGLNPATATAGGPAFTLAVNGSSFVSGCTVNWNGTAIAGTTFVSATQLTAPVTAAQIGAAGNVSVTVTCGPLTSAPAAFAVLAATNQTWTQLAPAGGPPGVRAAHTAVFDSTAKQMIVFAGGGSASDLNDVWSLGTGANPPQWTNITPSSETAPARRTGPSAVYDSVNSVMTIFGGGLGSSSPCTNDTWILTNANGVGGTPAWTQLHPTGTLPAARLFHQSVYDPGSNSMIMFGGDNCFGGSPADFFGDVWVLANANGMGGTPAWMQLTPSGTLPPSRENFSAVYDATANTMTIFDGANNSGLLSDVWVLSNANGQGGTPAWTQLSPAGTPPAARVGHTAVYDPSTGNMTIFGGNNATGQVFNDTWVLSNANGTGGAPVWNQLAPLGTIPPDRSEQTAVYDPTANQMIVFGGASVGLLNDVWTLSDSNAVISITSLIPGSVTTGSGAFTLTVNGAGFVPGSTVQWNSTSLTTTFVSAAELTASVSADLVASAGTASVTVLNPSGAASAAATIAINSPPPPLLPTLTITSGSAGEFAAGAAISASFTATGGQPPYSWSAGGLPGGLTLGASTGALSGSVATAGNFNFTVAVSDSASSRNATSTAGNIQILGITTLSPLTGATATKPYSQTFTAAGGSGSYTFSAPGAPAGLAFSGSTLSGTPTTAGTFTFQATVADGSGVTASASFTLVVAPGPVSITSSASVGEIALGSAVADTLAATGGKLPYLWTSSNLPAGVTLNASSGALGGIPTSPGNYNFTVQVSDSQTPPTSATKSLTLQVLGITTSSPLPGATGQQPYSQAFAAAGGSGTYTFSASGAPAGLAFSGPALSGTPTTAGTFTFQVTVADGSGVSASASFTLVVAPGPLSITSSASVGEIAFGTSVADNLAALGGKLPYMWSSSGLPAGVTLNASSGALGGIPTSPGNYNFTVQVSDAQTTPATASLTLTLQVLGLATPGKLPAAAAGTAYTQVFSPAGGAGPYTFGLSSAPAGLSFSGATLSGTPTSVGTFSFTASVTDANGFSASSLFSLVVNGPATPLTVTGGPLPGGTVGTSYSQAVTGTGGLPPYTWAVTGGALPAGLSLDGPSGVISGTPSIAGTFTFTAQATDGLLPKASVASGVFTITIAPKPLTVTGLPFPDGIVSSAYPLQILSASGGVAPYTFSAGSATPVPGLSFSSTGQLSGTPTTAGTFSFTITTSDAETPPLTLTTPAQVTVTPAGAANLILSSASLSFNLTTGASGLPVPYSITVQSSLVQQSLNYSVVATPAVSWLDVTGGGTTPGSIGIALDPSALDLGVSSLSTSVVVTCVAPSPCAGMAQTIGVSLSVTAPAPQLAFTGNLVQFSTTASVTTPVTQQVGIQNIGGGSAVISSATAADSWLTVSNVPAAVQSGPPVNITLTADPGTLGAGFFRTTVTIVSTGGTITVPVTFNIAQSPALTLSTTGAQFQSTLGSAPGNGSGSFQVGATGGTAVSFTAAVQPGASWLVLSAGSASGMASSSSAATVSYSIDPVAAAALSPAQAYYGTIAITASGVSNSPVDYEVVLNVASPSTLPAPDPEPAGLVFQTVFGSGAPPAQTVTVFTSSASPITYSASASTSTGGAWLSVAPGTGTSSASVPGSSAVTATPGTLPPGVYTGTVSYQFSAAAVRSVNVTLIVEQAGGTTTGSGRISTSSTNTTETTATCTPSRLVPTQTGLVSNFAQPTSWPTPLSILVVNDCGSAVAGGQVVATFSNGDPPLGLGLVNGGTGLYSGTWTPRTTSGQVTVTATATAPGFSASVATINGEVVANTAPILAAGGTLHIYDPLVGAAIGQGTILQIYGSGLGASPAVATSVPLTTTINGTSVVIGGIPAALYFVSAGQIDAQLPYELTPGGTYNVIVSANGQLSTPNSIQVTTATPGIAAFASGQIVAQHQDYSLVSETSPAVPGEYLVIYLSGLGMTGVSVQDGAASPDPSNLQLLSPQVAPTLTLNGTSIPIYFSGLSPGYVGLYQMNFQVPATTPNGDMQLVVSQGGTPSNSTILPVHN